MKKGLLIAVIVALGASDVRATSNLNLSKSNINRTVPRSNLVTASVDLSGQMSALLYQIPAAGDFILTQACIGPVTGGALFQVNGTSIAHVASGSCQIFSPGVILQPDSALTCTTFVNEPTFCMITGLLGPALPTPTPRL